MAQKPIELDVIERVCVNAIRQDIVNVDKAQENVDAERKRVGQVIVDVQARIEINHGLEPGSLGTTHQIMDNFIVEVEKKPRAIEDVDFVAAAV